MRLCLFGDLARAVCEDVSETVSRYETTGSETMKSHWAYSSLRSLRQISTWSSPQPAMTCSPLSSVVQTTSGSDLESFLRPSTSFGRSLPSFTLTATLTTGETLYFMSAMLWAVSTVVSVPDFNKYWSMPTSATVLPHGTSATCCVPQPIINTVRCTLFTWRSSLE